MRPQKAYVGTFVVVLALALAACADAHGQLRPVTRALGLLTAQRHAAAVTRGTPQIRSDSVFGCRRTNTLHVLCSVDYFYKDGTTCYAGVTVTRDAHGTHASERSRGCSTPPPRAPSSPAPAAPAPPPTYVPPPPPPVPAPVAPAAGFCDTHACIPNFPSGTGYIVQCADGLYSMSGGRPGACSGHGGVL